MTATDKSKAYIPLSGLVKDGWSKKDEATATCFCGAVQLAFVSRAPESFTLFMYMRFPPETPKFPSLLYSRRLTLSALIPPPKLPQPTQGPGLVDSFVCNCTDCRKITASMFASNFTVDDAYLKHLRGQGNLKTFGQSHSIASGYKMTNYFCSTCGTLMYRVGAAFPGQSILRIGTVDDFNLHETKLKPRVEQFTESRVGWLSAIDGVKQVEGSAYTKPAPKV